MATRLGNFSYKKRYVYNGVYEVTISDGNRTITTPNLSTDSKDKKIQRIISHTDNFMYYIDNGGGTFEDWMQSEAINFSAEKANMGNQAVVLQLIKIIGTKKPTMEKVIDVLKEISGVIPRPGIPAFLITDWAIMAVNYFNCKSEFKTLDDMM